MCGDKHAVHYPQRTICYATMAREAARRAWEDLHDEKPWHDGTFTRWAKERSSTYQFHRDDGVTIWVAPQDFSPEDDFLKPPTEVSTADLFGTPDETSDDEGGVDSGDSP